MYLENKEYISIYIYIERELILSIYIKYIERDYEYRQYLKIYLIYNNIYKKGNNMWNREEIRTKCIK